MASKRKRVGAAASATANPAGTEEEQAVNGGILQKLESDLSVIQSSTLFANAAKDAPLSIAGSKTGGRSGIMAPFNLEMFKASMKRNKEYKCGGNFFWLDMRYSSSPGVPLNKEAVAQFETHYFKDPLNAFPVDVCVAVPDLSFNPLEHAGALRSFSPDECKLAFLSALAAAVAAAAAEPTNTEALRNFKDMARSVTMHFKLLETEDSIYFAGLNARQDVVKKFETLARTAFQWIFEATSFRQRKVKLLGERQVPYAKVAALYNEEVATTEKQDPITEDFVKACHNVSKQIRCPNVHAILMWFEETYGQYSPFDSVWKLHAIQKKVSDPNVVFVLGALKDKLFSKKATRQDFPLRVLTGRSGGKGLLDLLLLKREVRDYFLDRHGPATVSYTHLTLPTKRIV